MIVCLIILLIVVFSATDGDNNYGFDKYNKNDGWLY